MFKKILLATCILAVNSYALANSTNDSNNSLSNNYSNGIDGKYGLTVKSENTGIEAKGAPSEDYMVKLESFKRATSEKCSLPNFDKEMVITTVPMSVYKNKNALATLVIINPNKYDAKKDFVLRSSQDKELCKVFQENGENTIHLTIYIPLDKPQKLELPTGDNIIFEVTKLK